MPEDIQYHGVTIGRWKMKGGRISHMVYLQKYLVVVGNLTNGFQFYGPFNDGDTAIQWATHNLKVGTSSSVHKMNEVRL